MKLLLPICTALVLSACGGTGQAPVTPGQTPGVPAPQAYPYNPNRNASESTDPRAPYYGEWMWAVTFPGGTVARGRISISKRVTPREGYANASSGAAVYCPNGDACPYESDTALIGSTSHGGVAELIVEMDDPVPDRVIRFVGVDLDGVVGQDADGRPTVKGGGTWNYDSARYAYVDFTLTQTSINPPVKAAANGRP